MADSARRARRGGARAALSLAAIGAVGYWALQQPMGDVPSDGHAFRALALALVLYAAATAARAERWHRILGRMESGAARRDSYGLTTVAYMGNNLLPAKAGEAMRVLILPSRCRVSRTEAAGSVLAERLLDAVALGLVFAFTAAHLVTRPAAPRPGQAVLLIAGAALAIAIVAVVWIARRRRGWLRAVAERVRPFFTATRQLAGPAGVALLALSAAVWCLEAGVYLAVADALRLQLDPAGALAVIAVANLFSLIPAAPGYVGTFDAGVLTALGALGTPASEGLPYLLVLRFVLFVPITLIGLVVLVGVYRRNPGRERRPAAACGPAEPRQSRAA